MFIAMGAKPSDFTGIIRIIYVRVFVRLLCIFHNELLLRIEFIQLVPVLFSSPIHISVRIMSKRFVTLKIGNPKFIE